MLSKENISTQTILPPSTPFLDKDLRCIDRLLSLCFISYINIQSVRDVLVLIGYHYQHVVCININHQHILCIPIISKIS